MVRRALIFDELVRRAETLLPRLLELRLADDLGGKGYLLFDGPVADVEAAVEIGAARVAGSPGLAWRVIARLHPEMADNLATDARFAVRVRG